MTSLELFRFHGTSLADVSDDDVETALYLAARRHTASQWGTTYAEAMALYAAHMLEHRRLAADGDTGGGGPVTSRRAGDLAVSYAAPTTESDERRWLSETTYGRQYLSLRGRLAAGKPRAVGIV